MFTANQVMKISGTLDKLAATIGFAMCIAGKPNDIAWQISGNKFILGYTGGHNTEGWNQYNHSTSSKKIAKDICKFLKNVKSSLPEANEGTYWDRGFLMSLVDGSEDMQIINSKYALVVFEPYDCYYETR